MFKAPETLDGYLSQVARELRELPAQARADELREIESHLRALVLASRQLEDIGEAEATAAALKQFGVPRRVGRNLRRAWERRQSEAWWRAVVSPIVGAIICTILSVICASGIKFGLEALYETNIGWAFPLFVAGIFLCLSIVFLTTGFVMGYISPKRGQIVFVSLFAVYSLALVLGGDKTFTTFTDNLLPLSYLYSLIFIMIGIHFGTHRARKRTAHIANTN